MSRRWTVFDTNVYIRHRLTMIPGAGLLSSVVLQELTAGARDNAEVRRLGTVRARATADRTLLTPSGEDWWFAGKVLNALYRGQASHRKGPTPAIPKEEQQRLVRDVLIARSAKRVNAAVATYNRADFEKISRFCNVRLADPEAIL
jgi:predicted nucleic acid-binding protein